jgi:hypothetical protein
MEYENEGLFAVFGKYLYVLKPKFWAAVNAVSNYYCYWCPTLTVSGTNAYNQRSHYSITL